MIELPEELRNTRNDTRFKTVSVKVYSYTDEDTLDIGWNDFAENFEEYVDPKDVEIARLRAEVKQLKIKLKPLRKPRAKLTPLDFKEIKELIRNGEDNTALGTQYHCSDSTISRIRIDMRKEGEDV